MPMHDWTRVPPGIYHSFHGRWIYAIHDALNDGRLPKGYSALAEQVTRTFGPDVLTLHNPATNGSTNGTPQGGANEPGGVALTTARPKAQIEATEERAPPWSAATQHPAHQRPPDGRAHRTDFARQQGW